MIIAIDGPAASGKTTVAKRLAEKLEFDHFDTGAMYRALTWRALRENIDVRDEKALVAFLKTLSINYVPGETGEKMVVNGQPVTEEIRTPEIDASVSLVAKVAEVRRLLVEKQRQVGEGGDFVVEGRDVGTVVFPGAALKIFLTASVGERAKRRQHDLREQGANLGWAVLRRQLADRDTIDSTRKSNPLRKAADAYVVDGTNKSVGQVVDEILRLYRLAQRSR